MTALEQAERFWANLMKLGTKRLVALGATGVAVFAIVAFAGYYLSRPPYETLYTGLDRQDSGQIASVLRDANIGFNLSPDGTTVMVAYGDTAKARVVLAEKGLPNSSNTGDELYDKLGSLGLTSFMQEVTRVRALEGELARSIQLMRGVKAARVHLVMPDPGSFRRQAEPPSASVIVRFNSSDSNAMAVAIRHLVAAAVPGMKVKEVTVLDTDGHLLASGEDLADAAPGQKLTLENEVSKQIEESIRRTLTPFLGLRNFRVSVATRLNTDKKQTKQTIYNPDSRVERSVRVTKQTQTSQNSTNQTPTSVTSNVPTQTSANNNNGKQSSDESQKRDELTNYEISSKTITTVSGGFSIENVSVAVLINRQSLIAALGGHATQAAIDKEMSDLQQLVASAAGIDKARGDSTKLSVVEFADSGTVLEPVPGPSFKEVMLHQARTIINGVIVLVVVSLLIWFAVRPTLRMAFGSGSGGSDELPMFAQAPMLTADGFEMPEPMTVPLVEGLTNFPGSESEPSLIGDLTESAKRTPLKRLEQIVEFDEEQAAAIMKLWMRQKGTA